MHIWDGGEPMTPKAIDVKPGDRYGRLTVVEQVPKPEGVVNGSRYWLCKCDCGTEKAIRGISLTSGNTKSCGCLRNEQLERVRWNVINYKRIDLIGRRFGKLTVVKEAPRPIDKIRGGGYWVCHCDCGGEKIVSSHSLLRSRQSTKSCGCLRIEMLNKTKEIVSQKTPEEQREEKKRTRLRREQRRRATIMKYTGAVI